jgi:MFS family permease
MSAPAVPLAAAAARPVRRRVVIAALGSTQILAWGSSYYLPAVLAQPIAVDTGWPLPWVVGGLSLGLLVSGLVSPRVGRAIEHRGGRPVLALSALLLAAGLALLAAAPSLPVYLAAWLVLGLGMGAGLYDAAFATLGRLYGSAARGAIGALTLWGGFASTVCWPLSAWLVQTVGWRSTCLAYAGLQLLVALPLHLGMLPRMAPAVEAPPPPASAEPTAAPRRGRPRLWFGLFCLILVLEGAISASWSVHLLTILQVGGLSLAAAVALGALVGPAQVGARLVEMTFGRLYHPLWTLAAASVLIALGLALLWIGLALPALPLICYGAGIGIWSIARGTVPLALFGPEGYAVLIGRLALPGLLAQALGPTLAAGLLGQLGPGGTLGALCLLALLNLAAVAALWLAAWPALAGRGHGAAAHP